MRRSPSALVSTRFWTSRAASSWRNICTNPDSIHTWLKRRKSLTQPSHASRVLFDRDQHRRGDADQLAGQRGAQRLRVARIGHRG